jgi:selenocysteine-specific translation elongation factor
MIIGTAGHIDHGKTTLVRALTGVDTDRLKASPSSWAMPTRRCPMAK